MFGCMRKLCDRWWNDVCQQLKGGDIEHPEAQRPRADTALQFTGVACSRWHGLTLPCKTLELWSRRNECPWIFLLMLIRSFFLERIYKNYCDWGFHCFCSYYHISLLGDQLLHGFCEILQSSNYQYLCFLQNTPKHSFFFNLKKQFYLIHDICIAFEGNPGTMNDLSKMVK